MDIEQAALEALRGEKIMVGVYGAGAGGPVDILVALDRESVPEVINEFTEYFSKRDPVDMAQRTLRAMMLVVDELPPHAQAKLIAPALVLASSTPSGIDGAMAIEITVSADDVQVEIYDLDHLETSETVH
ncbi:MAG: hypothetical protein O7A64_02700 [Alphaproteobacteria bacterium]|nr:hypothetical protein [Alphaproteobacteria bacterium]